MPVDQIVTVGTDLTDEAKVFTVEPLAAPPRPKKVTGPFGLWWFPLLVRLAEVFPWAKLLLDQLTAQAASQLSS